MAWTYEIPTGRMLDASGGLACVGYSGAPDAKNDPAFCPVRDVGPIPAGSWIVGSPRDSAEHGPYCLPLTPAFGTETYGRDGFLIHGESLSHPGAASKGCVIVPHAVRQRIWESGDHDLVVTAAPTTGEET